MAHKIETPYSLSFTKDDWDKLQNRIESFAAYHKDDDEQWDCDDTEAMVVLGAEIIAVLGRAMARNTDDPAEKERIKELTTRGLPLC
jgi:hypothetical protein